MTRISEDYKREMYKHFVQKKDAPVTIDTGEIFDYLGEEKATFGINAVFSKLIQEASHCERFAGDLYYDLKKVEANLTPKFEEKSYLFGFRDSGVDHDTFIFCRADNSEDYEVEYRK